MFRSSIEISRETSSERQTCDVQLRSQSLHSSDDRREPNPMRAKGGRKVDAEHDHETRNVESKDYIPVTVPFSAASRLESLRNGNHAREISAWANRCVWTDRMLNALIVGVRGGKWHALIDKVDPASSTYSWRPVRSSEEGSRRSGSAKAPKISPNMKSTKSKRLRPSSYASGLTARGGASSPDSQTG
jgi:hypothetical protein